MNARAIVFGPPLIVLALSTIFLAWAHSYTGRPGLMPSIVGWTLILLAALDIAAQTETPLGRAVKAFFTGTITGGAEVPARYPWRKTLIALAWPVGFVLFIYFFGFLPVIPVYVFMFMIVQGRIRPRVSLAVAGVLVVSIYVVFEVALRYEIYRGVVFGAL